MKSEWFLLVAIAMGSRGLYPPIYWKAYIEEDSLSSVVFLTSFVASAILGVLSISFSRHFALRDSTIMLYSSLTFFVIRLVACFIPRYHFAWILNFADFLPVHDCVLMPWLNRIGQGGLLWLAIADSFEASLQILMKNTVAVDIFLDGNSYTPYLILGAAMAFASFYLFIANHVCFQIEETLEIENLEEESTWFDIYYSTFGEVPNFFFDFFTDWDDGRFTRPEDTERMIARPTYYYYPIATAIGLAMTTLGVYLLVPTDEFTSRYERCKCLHQLTFVLAVGGFSAWLLRDLWPEIFLPIVFVALAGSALIAKLTAITGVIQSEVNWFSIRAMCFRKLLLLLGGVYVSTSSDIITAYDFVSFVSCVLFIISYSVGYYKLYIVGEEIHFRNNLVTAPYIH